jgi:CPA2 family monovalent cation:H+ antiporter-2
MDHSVTLIATIAVCFVLAFCFGFLAHRLRLPPLVGYLVAGILAGPFTPGLVADSGMAGQLAEVGVILLMFGVGLHFSPADLMAVRAVAVPGALAQIAIATALGAWLAMHWGWSLGAGVIFGLSLSVASTVVLLKALEERNALTTSVGRIAVGWLIVEDMAMVLALVLLPAFAEMLGGHAVGHGPAPSGGLVLSIAVTLGKVAAFVALAMILGPRVVPWVLTQVARTGSRELFTLSVLALALGIAYGSAQIFGVSFALGAFFAGVVLSESDFSHRAAAQSMPMQDAFAVLFFVSVGMLFDPMVIVERPMAVLTVLALIVIGKTLIAVFLVMALGFPVATALGVGVSLAQIGEFSFILAGLGIMMGILPEEGRNVILAGAILSITLSPILFALLDLVMPRIRAIPALRGVGQAQLSRLQERLDAVQKRTEAREAERSLKIQNLIDRFPVFADLGEEAREDLLLLFRPSSADPGKKLIRKGDRPDAAYFVSAGRVQVTMSGMEIELGPGDFFGEMALLSGARRSADVTALDFCELLMLTRRDFLLFLARYPGLRAGIEEVAASRLAMNESNSA